MDTDGVFEKERLTLQACLDALEADIQRGDANCGEKACQHPLRAEFEKLIKNYQKLTRQSVRVIHLSDRQQLMINEANDALQKSQEQLKIRRKL